MKRLAGLVIVAAIFAGCGKTETYSNDFSAAMVINGASGSTTFNVNVDDVNQTGTALVFRAASPYLNIRPGARKIEFRNINPALVVNYNTLPAENFVTNTARTYVVYDTLTSLTAGLRVVKLNDTLIEPAAGQIKFRFLPLAIFAPALDVTYLRTSVTPNDSVTISNLPYIGNVPSASTLEKVERFVPVPGGNYTIKLKLTGTQTVYSSFTFAPTVGGAFKGIYTFYTTGTAQGQAFGPSVVRNFP